MGPALSVIKSVSDRLSVAESVSVKAGVELIRLLVLQSSNYKVKHSVVYKKYTFITNDLETSSNLTDVSIV